MSKENQNLVPEPSQPEKPADVAPDTVLASTSEQSPAQPTKAGEISDDPAVIAEELAKSGVNIVGDIKPTAPK